MNCPNCGKWNSDYNHFCQKCGYGLKNEQGSIAPIKHKNDSIVNKRKDRVLKFAVVLVIAAFSMFVLGEIIGFINRDLSEQTNELEPTPIPTVEITPAPTPDTNEKNRFAHVRVGDTVEFGTYGNETVEWTVLEVRADKALLITNYGQDCIKYDNQHDSDFSPTAVSWYDCTLRQWLNEQFYYGAFSEEEREEIVVVDEDGINDKVFILSMMQLEQYLPTQKSRGCEATSYAEVRGSYDSGGCWWWIRSNDSVTHVTSVNSDGTIDDNTRVNGQKSSVRPVIWVKTK